MQISEVRFTPPGAGSANQFDVELKARAALVGPPCAVELVLPPERLPGFLGARAGTYRGTLTADAPLPLFARDLRFSETATGQGYVYVNVDNYTRAFVFRTAFPAQGTATTQRRSGQY